MMRSLSLLTLSLALLCASPAQAALRIYTTPVEKADWEYSGTALNCRLSHRIAGYGVAEFSQQPKGELSFRLQVKQAASSTGDARLLSLPASWRHYDNGMDLGTLPILPGRTPFYLGEEGAGRVMTELEAGMTPSLEYRDWVEPNDSVRVQLSPLKFSAALEQFRDCVHGLLSYTFEDVRQTVLLYDVNQTRLSASQKERLQQLVHYVSQDESVSRVHIDGYTDSKGLRRINLAVAKKRIKAAREYLTGQGVDASLISTRAYPETEGKFDNRTEAGRRKNRRLEITLRR